MYYYISEGLVLIVYIYRPQVLSDGLYMTPTKSLIFLLLLAGCSKPVKKEMGPVPVSVVRVEAQTIPADFEYIGVGQSSHIVELRARVEGYLESINYKEGGLVQQGDLMFVLDQRPFIAAA